MMLGSDVGVGIVVLSSRGPLHYFVGKSSDITLIDGEIAGSGVDVKCCQAAAMSVRRTLTPPAPDFHEIFLRKFHSVIDRSW